MRHLLVACLALLVLGSPVTAQEPARDVSLFEHLAGRWVLHGTIDGQETVHDVDARLVLNGGYVELHEVSREKDAAGTPAYEAIVLISADSATREFICLWLDNTSNQGLSNGVLGRATAVGDTIPFLLRSAAGVFHTTFIYDRAKDAWRWEMDDESNGKREPFARVTLTRVDGGQPGARGR